jgi:hypothetical protein
MIRGVSVFFPGTFPPETEIIKQIADGTIDPVFYSYVAAFVLTSVVAAFYQRKQKSLEDMSNFIKSG